ELFERQEFAYDAAIRMRDRFQRQEVWERVGVDVKEAIRTFTAADPNDDPFQQLLFAKIVPNCKRLGLLDANNGWLRQRFEEMRVIQFEDAMDTEAEYELLDAVALDRAAAPARG
ncbi:MAG: ferritin-like domain-containing protein, partial [Acidimicrobiia bacterium]|nr:ferritin-like domain-containing protein [Acidimicrobiia bacterium]